MPYLYVPGLGDSTSDSGLPWAGDYEPWVTLSGKPTQRPASWRGWKTRPWIRLLSGTISRASKHQRTAEEWISSVPEIRVSHTRSLASDAEQKTSETSGRTSLEPSKQFHQLSFFEKTCPGPSDTSSGECSQTYEEWATALSKDYSVRRKLVRRTDDSDSSSWPTPRTITGGAESAGRKKELGRLKSGGGDLQSAVLWATPAARDWRSENATQSPKHSPPLGRQVLRVTGQRCPFGLNPLFVESLMGLPTEWTDCDASVTESSLWWRLMRSELLRVESAQNG